ncbi:MAG: YhfC family glutamic-type intramembrane protease [Sulfolobales archaeon]
MEIIIPFLVAVLPAFTALTLVSRKDLKLWIISLFGGGGWMIALLLRQPLLLILTQSNIQYIYVAYIASFLAGVFEESFRLLLLRASLRKNTSIRTPLALGLGWGLTEAFIVYLIPVFIATNLIHYSWLELMPGAIERNSAILLHTSLSLILSRDIKDIRLLLIAVVLHTLINSAAVTSMIILSNVWFTEALIALISLLTFILAYALTLRLKNKN